MQQVVADEVYQGCEQNLAHATARALSSLISMHINICNPMPFNARILLFLAIAIHLLLWVPEEDEICSENRDRQ